MKYIAQLVLMILAIGLLGLLQFQLWFGETGKGSVAALKAELAEEQQVLANQKEANRILVEDVKDLKEGYDAIEEHARLSLGLIKPNETFVQISTPDTSSEYSDNGGDTEIAIEAIPE